MGRDTEKIMKKSTENVIGGPMPRLVVPLRVLRLTLKKKWFDMIASGEKKSEYRLPSQWILSRLPSGKRYDVVEFANGYGKHVPRVTVEFKGWDRNQGDNNPEWGAIPGEQYVIIRLGRVISLHNA